MTMAPLDGLHADGSVDPDVSRRVARAWLAGGLVGLPTETVYGLSADAQNESAVARVYRVKGRPADHPLIVHVGGAQAIAGWAMEPNRHAERLATALWPGALTVVVRRGRRAGDFITGGQDTVALRCPDHPVALACLRQLAEQAGDPARGVAAPSANRFGRVSPTTAAHVLSEVGSRLQPGRDLIVDGGVCRIGVESTIVDCTADHPRVLRPGAFDQRQVDAALAGAPARPAHAVQGRPDRSPGSRPAPRAPGTLPAHYSPAAEVVLVEADEWESDRLAALPVRGPTGLVATASVPTPPGWTRLLAPETDRDFAHGLYAALRRADELCLSLVVAVLPRADAGALAAAVRDRLGRAAHPG